MTLVINDQTDVGKYVRNENGMCGCLPREEYNGPVCASAPDDSDLIDWAEFPDRIADMERTKSSLKYIWQDSQIGVLNQRQTNYCWAFASVTALMVERAVMNLPFVRLSPSSVAGPITGYQNVGGYVEAALQWMIDHGVATEEFVPQTTLSRSDYKTGWQNNATMYKVAQWEDVGRNKQRQISKILQRKPLSCAFMFMSHAIMLLNVTDDNPRLPANNPNRYGYEPLNSWGDGIIKFEGSRALADNCYAITQASFVG